MQKTLQQGQKYINLQNMHSEMLLKDVIKEKNINIHPNGSVPVSQKI